MYKLTFANPASFVVLASIETWSFKRILLATKTKNWPRIFYSTSHPKMTKTELAETEVQSSLLLQM